MRIREFYITENNDNVEIIDTVTDHYRGQMNAVLQLKVNDAPAGYLEYTVYYGIPSISMIEILPKYRNRGYGKLLVKKLQSMYPDEEISWGFTTSGGSELQQSLKYRNVDNPEVIKKKQILQRAQRELKKLELKLEQLKDAGDLEKLRNWMKTVSDKWNKLNDIVSRLELDSDISRSSVKKIVDLSEMINEIDNIDEMALSTYKTFGDFEKPGPFRGADKRLVPHPKNIEKATRFFERTPYDFRLFFSNISGTGKWREHGPMSQDQIRQIFGQDAEEIIAGSEDAITVVYVGNVGDRKVMLTPWMMAHRFGHAIQAGTRNQNWHAWKEAENHFFSAVNRLLDNYYGKTKSQGQIKPTSEFNRNLTPEYNALFNAIGTQRSSRSGEIRRPYEFLYELFSQYLGTGKITLNAFPKKLGYGRKVWGRPTQYLNIKPEYRDEGERQQAAEILARDMEILFNDVLSASVGKIFVM